MASREIGSVPPEFRMGEVIHEKDIDFVDETEEPPLSVLANFTGIFQGFGLNQTFRTGSRSLESSSSSELSSSPSSTSSASSSSSTESDNILELNLTRETLTFSRSLGSVPNRNFGDQGTLFLNGVPYTHLISDVGNPISGLYDGEHTGIHFETGIWLNVPATTSDSTNSVVRMAAMSHGVTINAHCQAPSASINGPPTIPPVSITPFVTGSNPPELVPFAGQTASSRDAPRLPKDLSAFMQSGTITQDILDDPNSVLRNAISGQIISNTTVFTVSTDPPAPTLGSGTTDIASRHDSGRSSLNDGTISMSATFWIETVEYKLEVPPLKPSSVPINLMPPPKATQPSPCFRLNLTREITTPTTITVSCTQIQYSQVLLVEVGGITWPHVSVSTLVPIEPQVIPASAVSAALG
jgi:hypothetical protein